MKSFASAIAFIALAFTSAQAAYYERVMPEHSVTQRKTSLGTDVDYLLVTLGPYQLRGAFNQKHWFIAPQDDHISIRKRYSREHQVDLYLVRRLEPELAELLYNPEARENADPAELSPEELAFLEQVDELADKYGPALKGSERTQINRSTLNKLAWVIGSAGIMPFEPQDIIEGRVRLESDRLFRQSGYMWSVQLSSAATEEKETIGTQPTVLIERAWIKELDRADEELYLVAVMRTPLQGGSKMWDDIEGILRRFMLVAETTSDDE